MLKKKTTGQARTQLRALAESQGFNLCHKVGQRLQGEYDREYDTLTTLAPVKLAEIKDLPTLYVRWESELKKLAAIDPEYRLGKYQKRNIVDRALPVEVQHDIDRKPSRGHADDGPALEDSDELMNFVINLSQ